MHQLLELCLSKGVLTGSRAFQVPTENSDWDIVILESDIPYKELDQYDSEICACWNDAEEPCDADGVDSIGEIYNGSIWGPINQIVKYYLFEDDEDSLVTLNLFIYPDHEHKTVAKFNQVNALMMFSLTEEQRKHKPTRIKKFVEILKQLKIT